jgi:hypothetical protein
MPISTVGYYLKRWEFASKKPIKRVYEQKDENAKRSPILCEIDEYKSLNDITIVKYLMQLDSLLVTS